MIMVTHIICNAYIYIYYIYILYYDMWACLNIEYCFPLECSQFDAYLIFKQRTWGTANLRQIETAFSLHWLFFLAQILSMGTVPEAFP